MIIKLHSHDWYIWQTFVTSGYLPRRVVNICFLTVFHRLSLNVTQVKGITDACYLSSRDLLLCSHYSFIHGKHRQSVSFGTSIGQVHESWERDLSLNTL
jgi:hypothetical protein